MSLSLTVSQSSALDRLARQKQGLCTQGSTQRGRDRCNWTRLEVAIRGGERCTTRQYRDGVRKAAGKVQTVKSELVAWHHVHSSAY